MHTNTDEIREVMEATRALNSMRANTVSEPAL
jgi:hypothetical protein